jgi:hypothetical protein
LGKLLFIFRHRNPVTGKWREIVHEELEDVNALVFNLRTHLLTLGMCGGINVAILVDEWGLNPCLRDIVIATPENYTDIYVQRDHGG